MIVLGAMMKLLVVEDDPDLQTELLEALQMNGILACGVSSAGEALSLIASDPAITVMLTDVAMPGMDGLELTARVQQIRQESAAVEVILMTGHRALRTLPLGVFRLFHKPTMLKPLLEAIHGASVAAHARRNVARITT